MTHITLQVELWCYVYLLILEELHSLYRSPDIVKVIKSRRLRWAGHVARIEEGRSAFKILTGKPTVKILKNIMFLHRWEDFS